MLKHPRVYIVWSWCIVSFEKLSKFILNQFESTHHNLNRFIYALSPFCLNHLTKLSELHWIDSHKVWIESIFIWGTLESTRIYPESYHPSYFSGLSSCCSNRFIHLVNRFNLLFLCKNLVLSPLSINSLLLITPKVLNHLHLFSLGLKNSLLIHSSRLNTFS